MDILIELENLLKEKYDREPSDIDWDYGYNACLDDILAEIKRLGEHMALKRKKRRIHNDRT